jgi:hypothetical protein
MKSTCCLNLAACLLLAWTAGCVSLGDLVPKSGEPASGYACQMVATWTNHVVYTPDPAHNGDPIPGLAGRIYLFGSTVDYPMAGDGTMTIDLFDDLQSNPNHAPIEEWRIDRDTLRRLLRRDAIGQGYTLFLPWGTYRPEMTRVRLRLRYDPVKGSPLFTNGAPLTLNKDDESPTSPASTTAKATPPNPATKSVAAAPKQQPAQPIRITDILPVGSRN